MAVLLTTTVVGPARRAGASPGCREGQSGDARDTRPPRSPTIDPNLYVNEVDTLVTYDDRVNHIDYDDGWQPDAYRAFEAELAPYGTWADTDQLGRVWFPRPTEIGPAFVPYRTHGRWALTEYGWTWLSDWSWGRVVFHYGRWAVLPGRGWCWIPGTLWSPAWVAWRVGRAYVAWAALPPNGVGLGRPLGPRSPWMMVPARILGTPQSSYVPRRTVPALFSRTVAMSKPRTMVIGAVAFQINGGPVGLRDCKGAPMAATPFATLDAILGSISAIQPRPGVRLEDRPWVRREFRAQTPLCRWPPAPGSDIGACVSAASTLDRSNQGRSGP